MSIQRLVQRSLEGAALDLAIELQLNEEAHRITHLVIRDHKKFNRTQAQREDLFVGSECREGGRVGHAGFFVGEWVLPASQG
jgi:hypothetical protein